MQYNKVETLDDIKREFGNWYDAKKIAEDIVSFAGDSTVVEVSVDVGACLCSVVGVLDFSLINDYMGSDDKYAKLYLGKIKDTEIHLFTVDEFQLISPPPSLSVDGRFPNMNISIQSVVAKAEEKELKISWNPKELLQDLKVLEYTQHTHGAPSICIPSEAWEVIDKAPGTEFQKRIWKYLWSIPKGETRTYKQVAIDIGKRSAYRAVANACGKNPDAPRTPCHRVVSENGIGGYSGEGGVARKIELLKSEGVDVTKFINK